MIDVIGQSGHYPPNATTLNGFVVKASSITGCTRLCQGFGEAGVTIDRFTGQVIDKQIEVVNEQLPDGRQLIVESGKLRRSHAPLRS